MFSRLRKAAKERCVKLVRSQMKMAKKKKEALIDLHA